MVRRVETFVPLAAGSRVRIQKSTRAPYAGRYGTIASFDENDSKGPYLVRFEDDTQFRYRPSEVEPVPPSKPNVRNQ